ncbi:MAG TPA: hypothetical protein EYP51_05205 [Thiotrichales bacterium]|nr:hypothetical protein [Thiotrichales bacterium]
MSIVTFLGIECDVVKKKYHANQQTALQLFVADTRANLDKGWSPGDPVLTATSCLPDHCFKSGETAIKNYSENEGILDVLLDAEIISSTGDFVASGYSLFPVVEVLI